MSPVVRLAAPLQHPSAKMTSGGVGVPLTLRQVTEGYFVHAGENRNRPGVHQVNCFYTVCSFARHHP